LHFRLYRYLTNYVYETVSLIRFPANRQKEIKENTEELSDYLEINLSSSILRVSSDEIDKNPDRVWQDFPYFRIENIPLEYISDEVTLSDYCDNTIEGDLVHHLEFLSTIEEETVKKYFGLNGCKPLTLEEISKDYSLTRERIRQLKERAVEKLQHPVRKSTFRLFNISYDYLFNSSNYFLDKEICFSRHFSAPSHNIMTEDKKSYGMLKESTIPFRRINRIPGVNNMASVCRNLIVKTLSEVDHPLSKSNIVESILNLFPSMSETVIEYAISTTEGIENKHGEYILSSNVGKDSSSRIRLSPFFREFEYDNDDEFFN